MMQQMSLTILTPSLLPFYPSMLYLTGEKQEARPPMEKNTTPVNKQWIFCTFASFLGFSILLVSLCHGRYRQSLPALQELRASSTATTKAPLEVESLRQVHGVAEDESLLKATTRKCDIFNGKWVYDTNTYPLYKASQCPFLSDQVSCRRNGRPDFDYERWRWEPQECEIPRFNGTDMLERLRGKRVIIVGDSINRNQWESLSCLLYSVIPPSRAEVNERSGVYKVFRAKIGFFGASVAPEFAQWDQREKWCQLARQKAETGADPNLIWLIQDYNCSVEFYWSPFLVQLDGTPAKGSRVLKLDAMAASARKWHGADIMVFNTGHWWVHRGKLQTWDFLQYNGKLLKDLEVEAAFEIGMKTWAHWIERNVNPTKTTVFFRSISPEHKLGKQWCHNQTQPIMDESYIELFPRSITAIVEKTIEEMRTPVKYLNITRLSQYRKEAHPTVYTSKQGKLLTEQQRKQPRVYGDCSHWCLPGLPDTWNVLLYASLVLNDSREIL